MVKNVIYLVLLILLLTANYSFCSDTVEINLLKNGVVSGDVIRIGDISKVNPKCEGIEKIIISWSPSNNHERRISKLTVASSLKNKFDFPISLTGANYVRVLRKTDPSSSITKDDLKAIILSKLFQIREDLKNNEMNINLKLITKKLPSRKYKQLKIEFGNTSQNIISGKVIVIFGERFKKNIMFKLSGNIEKSVIKSARFIKKGETLKKSDFYTDYVVGGLKKSRNGMNTIPSNVEAKINIREGMEILPTMFSPHYVIKKGDKFMLKSGNEHIRLEVEVKAMENGNIGDIIRVKNIDSGKIIRGLIKSEDRVCSIVE